MIGNKNKIVSGFDDNFILGNNVYIGGGINNLVVFGNNFIVSVFNIVFVGFFILKRKIVNVGDGVIFVNFSDVVIGR